MSDGFNGAIPAHPTTIPVDVEVEQGTVEVGGRPHGRFEIEQEELEAEYWNSLDEKERDILQKSRAGAHGAARRRAPAL